MASDVERVVVILASSRGLSSFLIMLADRPRTQAALAAAGITTHAVVRAEHLLRAAGGLACATGILGRALVSDARR